MRRHHVRTAAVLVLVWFCGILCTVRAEELFRCSFDKDGWSADDWIVVKSPRWDHFGGWVQRDGYIENETPTDATSKEMHGKRAAETYSSMVLKRVFSGSLAITANMAFADRMAPLVVIAPELGEDAAGRPEYREHFEVVLFDQGVNIWHHSYQDGKPSWIRAAYARFPLKPDEKYELQVKIAHTRRGKVLSVIVDGHEMGYTDNSLPDRYHVGITGCEGVNRFYDFAVTQGK